MAQEIERKFLVVDDSYKQEAYSQSRIVQGYICSARGRTVRVRIRGDKGYLTIKGASNASGMSRYEWEKEISLQEAEELMKLCEPGVIDKTRYLVKSGKERDTDILLIGFFEDGREGLELYGDYLAKAYQIHLPAKPEVYCTWYHRNLSGSGASTEKLLAENADFANVFANANVALNNNKLQALRIPLVFFSTSFRDTIT